MAVITQKPGSAQVSVQITGWKEIGEQLERLPIEARGIELEKAVRKGLNRIKKRARELVPPPGYPGDKPGLKPLRDTIGTVLRRYKGGVVIAGVVGPEYPAGAHGHLVEHGHRIAVRGTGTLMPKPWSKRKSPPKSKIGRSGQGVVGGMVKPRPFMAPAVADVAPQIETDIVSALSNAANKASGGFYRNG